MTAAEVDLLNAVRPLLESIAAVDDEDEDGKVGNGNPPAPCPADVPIILIPEEFEAEPALTALCPTPAPICAEVELELTDLEAAVEDDPSAEGYLGTDPVVLVANGCILGGPPAEGLMFKYLLVVGVSGLVKLKKRRRRNPAGKKRVETHDDQYPFCTRFGFRPRPRPRHARHSPPDPIRVELVIDLPHPLGDLPHLGVPLRGHPPHRVLYL